MECPMCPKSINNQQLILEAAEAEFLEKGYEKARTTEIAKRAGVNHAMLHYYFQSKEKLFHRIFEDKAKMMHQLLLFNLHEDLPFLEKIQKHIEQHFDFMAENNKIPGFIILETLRNPSLRDIVTHSIQDKIKDVLVKLKKDMDKEVKKGTIRCVDPHDLIFSIVSLNSFCFLNHQALSGVAVEEDDRKKMLEKRKKMNVEIIINWLRI
ncbi:MAG: TetR/AcrR family transcriptional regulator [Bacteroides sp.]|nr:TetR/AcrR family transcriptional regulator [Bacteroides sp.]